METFLNFFLITAALGGFALAFLFFISKRKAKPIACPMDGHCDDVVRSEFSKFFGIPVEILGMLYYASVAATYSIFIFIPVWPFRWRVCHVRSDFFLLSFSPVSHFYSGF